MSAAVILAAALTIGGHVTESEHFSMRDCVIAAQAQYQAGREFATCDGRPVPRAVVRQVALDENENRLASIGMSDAQSCLEDLRVDVSARTHSVWCMSYVQFDGLEIIQVSEGWNREGE
ncbi:hypothetical protein ACOTJR_27985 [Achromobacter xylosoxidans]